MATRKSQCPEWASVNESHHYPARSQYGQYTGRLDIQPGLRRKAVRLSYNMVFEGNDKWCVQHSPKANEHCGFPEDGPN
jgi:hypothetical protein